MFVIVARGAERHGGDGHRCVEDDEDGGGGTCHR